jgi:hypothetical protein
LQRLPTDLHSLSRKELQQFGRLLGVKGRGVKLNSKSVLIIEAIEMCRAEAVAAAEASKEEGAAEEEEEAARMEAARMEAARMEAILQHDSFVPLMLEYGGEVVGYAVRLRIGALLEGVEGVEGVEGAYPDLTSASAAHDAAFPFPWDGVSSSSTELWEELREIAHRAHVGDRHYVEHQAYTQRVKHAQQEEGGGSAGEGEEGREGRGKGREGGGRSSSSSSSSSGHAVRTEMPWQRMGKQLLMWIEEAEEKLERKMKEMHAEEMHDENRGGEDRGGEDRASYDAMGGAMHGPMHGSTNEEMNASPGAESMDKDIIAVYCTPNGAVQGGAAAGAAEGAAEGGYKLLGVVYGMQSTNEAAAPSNEGWFDDGSMGGIGGSINSSIGRLGELLGGVRDGLKRVMPMAGWSAHAVVTNIDELDTTGWGKGWGGIHGNSMGRTHTLLQYRTPGVEHMSWMGPQRRVEARATRAWLPDSQHWCFAPRAETHDKGSWYIETREETREEKRGEKRGEKRAEKPLAHQVQPTLQPLVICMAAAYRTLDGEREALLRTRTPQSAEVGASNMRGAGSGNECAPDGSRPWLQQPQSGKTH